MFLSSIFRPGRISLAGAVAVVIGLYIVLWAKGKDQQQLNDGKVAMLPEKIDLEAPLLMNKATEKSVEETQN